MNIIKTSNSIKTYKMKIKRVPSHPSVPNLMKVSVKCLAYLPRRMF